MVQKLIREMPLLSVSIHHKWWTKLDDNNSVFQAEMVALSEAMRWLSQESLAKCTIIHTDSQSSLKALAALQPNSTIAPEILNIWSSLKAEAFIADRFSSLFEFIILLFNFFSFSFVIQGPWMPRQDKGNSVYGYNYTGSPH
ncbi:hypothetical protein AVEN_9601-1 [Araneus ventricosus]|uniref:RNase H type-1 domain-containing protein n=1 Tax=Araneus ventricosus TaxID=182803 RepID=A0A4Y2KG19_ARAVE|nr:hypothetical protein AVEN_9601-1 [Araneus ventricosus]